MRSTTTSTTAAWKLAQRSATSVPVERRDPLGLDPHRRLQAGEREIRLRAAEHGPRQVEALGIAAAGLALDLRPARIAEAEELGDLVEGLADGVVDGGAEADVIADAAHRDELRVPARDEEEQIGEADAVGEPRRQRMALEVVDGEQRLAGDERQRLGGGQPDDARRRSAPGPAAAAMPSRSAKLQAGLVHGARATSRSITSTWARAAISGTTPP